MSPYIKKLSKRMAQEKFMQWLDKLEGWNACLLVRTDLYSNDIENLTRDLYQTRADRQRISTNGYTIQDMEKYFG